MAEFRIPSLNAADSRLAQSVFEFIQFLLDDDGNLTPAGNLSGAARQKLRGRLQELIAAETPDDAAASAASDHQSVASADTEETP